MSQCDIRVTKKNQPCSCHVTMVLHNDMNQTACKCNESNITYDCEDPNCNADHCISDTARKRNRLLLDQHHDNSKDLQVDT